MIDHCPFTLPAKYIEAFENDPQLNFESKVNLKTAEQVTETRTAQLYGNLTSYPTTIETTRKSKPKLHDPIGFIQIRKNLNKGKYVYISINLQYVFNGLKDNSRQFTISQVIHTINNLLVKRFYNFDKNEAKLYPPEFGVNLPVDFDPDLLLINSIMHNYTQFNVEIDSNKTFYKAKHSNKNFKLYNKGKQYHLSECNLLRIENDYTRMVALEKAQIKTLNDLTDIKKLQVLAEMLVSDLKKLVVFDWKINPDKLPLKTQLKLFKGKDYQFWAKYTNSNSKTSALKRYKKLMVDVAGRNIVNDLAEQLENHIKSLFDVNVDCTGINALPICENPCKTISVEIDEISELATDTNYHHTETDCTEKKLLISVQNDFETTIINQTWSVDEMEQYFENATLPDGPIRLSACETITAPKLFLESHFATVKAKAGNKYFQSDIKRLQLLRSILERYHAVN